MDERTERFIERMGMFVEADGLPRIAGRIFGLLLVQADPCSLDDMADALGVSKGSISTDARLLEQFGLLQRITRPGDRRDYYTLSEDCFARTLEVRLQRMQRFHALIDEARSLPNRNADVKARLDEMDRAYELAVSSMTDALERWEHGRATASARRR